MKKMVVIACKLAYAWTCHIVWCHKWDIRIMIISGLKGYHLIKIKINVIVMSSC